LAIETYGGIATPLIERNTTIPTKRKKEFTTAADNQTAVEIHVTQGERKFSNDNMTLGRFHLVGIPPAPRGVPKIEVSFDIDANGITNVTAKDLGTGNEQSITITASTNLNDQDIDRMVKDAERYAEEDEKRKTQIESKNMAEQMVYQGEKLIKDNPDKIPDDLKKEFETEAESLKKHIESENFEGIKQGTERVQQVIHKISEKIYGQQAPGGPGGFDPSQMQFDPSTMGAAGQPTGQKSDVDDEDVVDVDFEDLDE
jgi:molecular chaperone DnaK